MCLLWTLETSSLHKWNPVLCGSFHLAHVCPPPPRPPPGRSLCQDFILFKAEPYGYTTFCSSDFGLFLFTHEGLLMWADPVSSASRRRGASSLRYQGWTEDAAQLPGSEWPRERAVCAHLAPGTRGGRRRGCAPSGTGSPPSGTEWALPPAAGSLPLPPHSALRRAF